VSRCPLLTLYSKPGCHLCEELAETLDELQPEWGFSVEEIDITRDDELLARYRHGIPVLVCGTEEIARGRVDARDLVDRLRDLTSR
jgi:glutaredoxin